MSEQEQRDIARKILTSLYDAWKQHTIISLDPVREEGQWDEGIFDTVVEKLEEHRGLIKNYGTSYTYTITPDGILYAEENGMVPEAEVERQRQSRAHLLSFLAQLYETEGSLADANYQDICEGATADKVTMLNNLSLLNELGYVRDTSSSSYQITDNGLRHFRGDDYADQLI